VPAFDLNGNARQRACVNARYMRSVNGPRQKAAYVNEDVIPRIEIVKCMEGS